MPDQPPSSPAPAAEVAPADAPGLSTLVTLAVGVVALAALAFGKDVFVPIVIAVLLSFVLAPFVDFLRRLRLGRVPSVIIAVVTALGIILSLGGVIGVQIAQLASGLPQYEATIRTKLDGVKEGVVGRFSGVLQHLGRQIERATEESAKPNAPQAAGAGPEEPKPLPVEVHQPDPTPLQLFRSVALPVLEPLATTGIIFIVVVFILMQREDLRDRMIRLFGSSDLHRTTIAMDDAAKRLSKYYLTQLMLNAGFGVFIAVALWLIGVPSPVLWGIFAALMRFVPYVGSILAGAIPALLAAAVDPGWTMAIMTVGVFLISEPIMGHIIEPLVYGQSTGLSPFALIVSAIFWTWLWGPVGLLLSTPLTVCLVVLGRHVERLEFLDVLLGDRPALTPIENFYQRILAGDPDEALEHAEQLLKERSLSSYYDEVALRGLQLAAEDARRGVLTPQQLDRMEEAIRALVEDLEDFDDTDPDSIDKKKDEDPLGPSKAEKEVPARPAVATAIPPLDNLPEAWRSEAPIMCIAGRGHLDEAASTMLAQLLGKHGLKARVVPHEAVSRSNVIGLDVTGVAMVCISYLDLTGSPAHLRYLLRRLRQKLPNAPMLVGLWPVDDPILKDEVRRQAVGADYAVTTLHEAITACVDAAHKAAEAQVQADTAALQAERPAPRRLETTPTA